MAEAKDHIGATVRVMLDTREVKGKKKEEGGKVYPVKLRVIYNRTARLYAIKCISPLKDWTKL